MPATDPRHGYYITVEEGRFADGTKYYTAIAPELQNCLFQADTRAKAREGICEVISHMVELIIEKGNTPPKPLLPRSTTVGFHQDGVTTGFSDTWVDGGQATSLVCMPHSTASETIVHKQVGRELITV